MNAERLAYLVSRSLTAEHDIASVSRAHTVYRDRIALSVVDTDGDRWRPATWRRPRFLRLRSGYRARQAGRMREPTRHDCTRR